MWLLAVILIGGGILAQAIFYYGLAKNAPMLNELGLPEECGVCNKSNCKDCKTWKKYKEAR